jgi:hypothetical protein
LSTLNSLSPERNGISNVWYSSEVAGTILVQCIPILRPFLREVHASLTSKRLPSETTSHRSWAWSVSKKRDSTIPDIPHIDLKLLDGAGGTNGLNFGFNETKISSNTGLELDTIREHDGEEKGGITRGRSFRTVTSKRSEHFF